MLRSCQERRSATDLLPQADASSLAYGFPITPLLLTQNHGMASGGSSVLTSLKPSNMCGGCSKTNLPNKNSIDYKIPSLSTHILAKNCLLLLIRLLSSKSMYELLSQNLWITKNNCSISFDSKDKCSCIHFTRPCKIRTSKTQRFYSS